MKYTIEINGIVEAEAGTRDVAIMIANMLHNTPTTFGEHRKVKVYKDGEFLYETK